MTAPAYLSLKESRCQHCYKCIRHCPVKSISFASDHADIIPEECILCGECYRICPQSAKSVRDDLGRAKVLIVGDAPVYASLAPSFAANYKNFGLEAMRGALSRLGFAGADETAVGATLVKRRYEEMIHLKEQDVLISSCCHSVNTLVRKYFPEALPSLANVVSPMMAHCAFLKREHPGAKTVFIGPCISKKAEADQFPGPVDCVLTFAELSRWLEENGMDPEGTAGEENSPESRDAGTGRTRLFPLPGGILRSMLTESGDYNYVMIDGVQNCIGALRDIAAGNLSRCFVEMSACAGSCVGGPVMKAAEEGAAAYHGASLKARFRVEMGAGRGDFAVAQPDGEELRREFPPLPERNASLMRRDLPGGDAIERILRMTGKTKPEDELNCGGCGYDTCREKAEAILTGKADPAMCLSYLKERAESFSNHIIKNTPNGILVLDESLTVQQINEAALRILNLESARGVAGINVSELLDPSPFAETLKTGVNQYDTKEYLAAQDKFVMMTIVHDRDYNIVIGVLRDVTEDETRRQHKEEVIAKTVELTDEVLAKQMRSVQEIASLLGETAAETQIALANLKGILRDD